MKKFFAIAAAAMMFSASANTLSLYDGTEWSHLAPINTWGYDEVGSRTQVLYPAADLVDMVGKKITAITFYTDESGVATDGGLMDLSMGETEVAVMTGYVEGLTKVGTGTMVKHQGEVTEVTFTFDTPYEYNGGNLVFENIVVEKGTFAYTYFEGIVPDYQNCVIKYFSVDTRAFLPKTTFTYDGGDTPEPELLRGDINNDKNVNISDVTALINLLLKGDVTVTVATDCNADGNANISDVTALINYLLKGQW